MFRPSFGEDNEEEIYEQQKEGYSELQKIYTRLRYVAADHVVFDPVTKYETFLGNTTALFKLLVHIYENEEIEEDCVEGLIEE